MFSENDYQYEIVMKRERTTAMKLKDRCVNTALPIDELHFQWLSLQSSISNFSTYIVHTYALLFVQRGSGVISLNDQHKTIRESYCLLILPGTRVKIEQQKQRFQIYMLKFNVFYDGRTMSRKENENNGLSALGNHTVVVHPVTHYIQLFEVLDECKQANSALDKLKRSITVQQLVYSFAVCAMAEKPISSREAVEQTISYIQENYQQEMSLAALASMANIGVRQYSHIFKQITGCTPISYLQQIRIKNAKQLMRSFSCDMQSIARQVGYKDEFYFSRKFKQLEGVSPTAYLRNPDQRVIGLLYTSHLLALGITPIGVPDYHLFRNTYVEPYLKDMQSFVWAPCDINHLKSMKPDVILGYEHMTLDEYENLSQIAEVIQIPWQTSHLYEQLENVANIFHKHKEVHQWMDKHIGKVEMTRERLKTMICRNDTIAAILLADDGFYVAGGRNIGHVLYRSLKLTPHPAIQSVIDVYDERSVYSEKIPLSELERFDASRLVIMPDSQSKWAEETFQQLRQSAQWNRLQAVQQGNVHLVPYNRWWMYTPLAIDGQLDDICRWIKA